MRGSKVAVEKLQNNIRLADELRRYALGLRESLPEIPGLGLDLTESSSSEDLRAIVLRWNIAFMNTLGLLSNANQRFTLYKWSKRLVIETNEIYTDMYEALVLRLQKLATLAA